MSIFFGFSSQRLHTPVRMCSGESRRSRFTQKTLLMIFLQSQRRSGFLKGPLFSAGSSFFSGSLGMVGAGFGGGGFGVSFGIAGAGFGISFGMAGAGIAAAGIAAGSLGAGGASALRSAVSGDFSCAAVCARSVAAAALC